MWGSLGDAWRGRNHDAATPPCRDAARRPACNNTARTAAASHLTSRLHSAKPARNGHWTRLDSYSTSNVFTDRRSPLFIDSSSAAAVTLSKSRRAMMRTYSHVTSRTCSSSCSSCQRPMAYGLWPMDYGLWPRQSAHARAHTRAHTHPHAHARSSRSPRSPRSPWMPVPRALPQKHGSSVKDHEADRQDTGNSAASTVVACHTKPPVPPLQPTRSLSSL
jgi:hypothetical protein